MSSSGERRRGRDMVYPVFGVLLNAYVVTQSMRAVGQLRHRFNITPPSIEAHADMKDDQKELWYRTYRAQINCIEWFSLTSPVFIGGAIVGKKAFGKYGKYVPRFLGACAILNAYARYKYLKAYQEEAAARRPYFHQTKNIVMAAFAVAMAACFHLMYKDAKCLVDKYRSK